MSDDGHRETTQGEAAGSRERVLDYRTPAPNRGDSDYRRLTVQLAAVCFVLYLAPLGGRSALVLSELDFLGAGILSLVVLGVAIAAVCRRQGWRILLLGIACPAAWIGAQVLYFDLGFGAMRHAAESSYVVHCASDLRQIGQGIVLYAQRNNGAYPPSPAALYLDDPVNINPAIFVCSGSRDQLATGSTPQQVAAKLAGKGYCSYTYVGQSLTTTAGPDDVVAFDAADQHLGDGMNVLSGDGSVLFLGKIAAKALIKQVQSGTRPVRFPAPATSPVN